MNDVPRDHTVPLEGVEPPTLSLGRNCSSIELQRREHSVYLAAVSVELAKVWA